MDSKTTTPEEHALQSLRPAGQNHPPRRRRTRRRAIVATAVLGGVLAGVGLGSTLGGSDPSPTADRALAVPANTSGNDGSTLTYGSIDAKDTVHVYEDMRCPYCKKFETTLGPTLTQLADSGQVKIEFHMAAFLDKKLGGKGSQTALAALGAAMNESPAKFKQFHDALYKAQPDNESTDTYASTATLLQLADQVPGLRTPQFNKAVKEGTYMPWAQQTADDFYRSNATGTPTLTINDTPIDVLGADGNAITPQDFTTRIDKALQHR